MQKCRNAEMQKCRNAEMQKCRNAEMQKCRNAEMQKCRKYACILYYRRYVMKKNLKMLFVPVRFVSIFVVLFCLAAFCSCDIGSGNKSEDRVIELEYPEGDDNEPGTFEGLSAKTEKQILQLYRDYFLNKLMERQDAFPLKLNGYSMEEYYASLMEQYTIEGFWIEKYLGTYDDSVAVICYNEWWHWDYRESEKEIIIDGVSFHSNQNAALACVYIEGKLYGLREAYYQGLLSKDDLVNIAYYHNEDIIFPERVPPFEDRIPMGAYPIIEQHNENHPDWWGYGDSWYYFDDDIVFKSIFVEIDNSFTDCRFYASDFKLPNIAAVQCFLSIPIPDLNYHYKLYVIAIDNIDRQIVFDTVKELRKLDFVVGAWPTTASGIYYEW